MPDLVHFDTVCGFCGDDRELFRKILTVYITAGREDIRRLLAALPVADWEQVRESAHKQRNFTGMINAVTLGKILQSLDRDPKELEQLVIIPETLNTIRAEWDFIESAAEKYLRGYSSP